MVNSVFEIKLFICNFLRWTTLAFYSADDRRVPLWGATLVQPPGSEFPSWPPTWGGDGGDVILTSGIAFLMTERHGETSGSRVHSQCCCVLGAAGEEPAGSTGWPPPCGPPTPFPGLPAARHGARPPRAACVQTPKEHRPGTDQRIVLTWGFRPPSVFPSRDLTKLQEASPRVQNGCLKLGYQSPWLSRTRSSCVSVLHVKSCTHLP